MTSPAPDAPTRREHLQRLADRVAPGTLEELQRMGSMGAPLIAQLVGAPDDQLARFDEVIRRRSAAATRNWGALLTLAQPVLAAVSRTHGRAVVAELATQLQAGTTTVAEIAARYGIPDPTPPAAS